MPTINRKKKPFRKRENTGPPTPEMTAAARAMNAARWKDIPPEERSKIGAWVASFGAGRPRTEAKRCPCKAMTLKLAITRADANGTGLGHKAGCRFFRDYRIRTK